MTDRPYDVRVYDKAFGYLGQVRAPVEEVYNVRHMGQSTGSIRLSQVDAYRCGLTTEGSRVVVRYEGEHLTGGPVRLEELDGPARSREYTAEVSDDWRVMTDMLGFPVPGITMPAQGVLIPGQTASEYDTRTGPAETVAKGFVAANATRLGLPLTVPASEGRGDTVTVQARMQPITDRILPVVDQAGIGLRVRQEGAGLVLDTYEPRTFPRVLSEDAATLASSVVRLVPPEFTRVVVGGKGDGTARDFYWWGDTATETALGYKIEKHVDARDVWKDGMTTPQYVAGLEARAREYLAEGAKSAGLELVLSESSVFRYSWGGGMSDADRRGYRQGDVMPVTISPGQTVHEPVRTVTLAYTRGEGQRVLPQAGGLGSALATLVKAVRATQRTQRRRVD